MKRAKEMLRLGGPIDIVTDSAGAERKLPEGVTHEQQAEYLEVARRRAHDNYEAERVRRAGTAE